MPNTVYPNFFLANEIEDQYNSHLDLQQFCTVNNDLVGVAGMQWKVNVYTATNGTEKLAMGVGNTQTITAGYAQTPYTILLAQNRFKYFDEEEMTDPIMVQTGTRHMGTDLFNTVNADAIAEFNNATLSVTPPAGGIDFDVVVDAVALMNLENLEGTSIFGLINPTQVATFRKNLKNTLQYVEAWAKQGYIGTVGGVSFYTSKIVTDPIIATKEAVTVFNKKGVEVEQERDANTRENTVYSRKYYLCALTDATKVVKIA